MKVDYYSAHLSSIEQNVKDVIKTKGFYIIISNVCEKNGGGKKM